MQEEDNVVVVEGITIIAVVEDITIITVMVDEVEIMRGEKLLEEEEIIHIFNVMKIPIDIIKILMVTNIHLLYFSFHQKQKLVRSSGNLIFQFWESPLESLIFPKELHRRNKIQIVIDFLMKLLILKIPNNDFHCFENTFTCSSYFDDN